MKKTERAKPSLTPSKPLKHRVKGSYACAHCGASIDWNEPHLVCDRCGYWICCTNYKPCPK